jgi:hypothetical protein
MAGYVTGQEKKSETNALAYFGKGKMFQTYKFAWDGNEPSMFYLFYSKMSFLV